MRYMIAKCAAFAVWILIGTAALFGQEKRAIEPRDCISVRDLLDDDISWHSTIKISPDGSRVAYPVRIADMTTNTNEIEVYVRNVTGDHDQRRGDVPMLRASGIGLLQWRPDGRHLVFLLSHKGRASIELLDADTGNRSRLATIGMDVAEFSIDRSGDTIVFSVDVSGKDSTHQPTRTDSARGYRIPFQEPTETIWPQRKLFAIYCVHGVWSKPLPLVLTSPLSGTRMASLTYLPNNGLETALSPSGRFLLLNYLETSQVMPTAWKESAYKRLVDSSSRINAFYLTVLYDLATGKTTLPVKSPFVLSAPVWSPDGRAFAVVGQPTIGSSLETEESKNGILGHSAGAQLYWAEPSTGSVEVVASHLAYPWEGPLSWEQGSEMIVRLSSMSNATRLERQDGRWQTKATYSIPLAGSSQLATNGRILVGSYSDPQTPPELFEGSLGASDVHVFSKLNPEFDNLTIAPTKEVHWRTATGFQVTGLLLLPPGYVEGNRYPLVIQTKPFTRGFACSFGDSPSFAPQPIANAGILYLGLVSGKSGAQQRMEDYYPKGYPGFQGTGGIAEAAFNMELWESAVATLDAQGLIDKNKVGIIGFSRTGWYTEFILSHSATRYRAATIADNVEYSLGEYWLRHDVATIRAWDAMYGGPPYGSTLSNWLKYSISFNLENIHTPVLMEEMGDKQTDSYNRLAPPRLLAESFEVFTGLNRLQRPVELYYYPDDDHSPNHPLARLATLQRNLDWYRFWLQGYERPGIEDIDQYKRWRGLLNLQERDEQREGGRPSSRQGSQ